jgi:hypothetical protein
MAEVGFAPAGTKPDHGLSSRASSSAFCAQTGVAIGDLTRFSSSPRSKLAAEERDPGRGGQVSVSEQTFPRLILERHEMPFDFRTLEENTPRLVDCEDPRQLVHKRHTCRGATLGASKRS